MSEGNELDQGHSVANRNIISLLRNRRALPWMGTGQRAEEKNPAKLNATMCRILSWIFSYICAPCLLWWKCYSLYHKRRILSFSANCSECDVSWVRAMWGRACPLWGFSHLLILIYSLHFLVTCHNPPRSVISGYCASQNNPPGSPPCLSPAS